MIRISNTQDFNLVVDWCLDKFAGVAINKEQQTIKFYDDDNEFDTMDFLKYNAIDFVTK